MEAYRRGMTSKVICMQAHCLYTGSSSEPNAFVTSMGKLFYLFRYSVCWWFSVEQIRQKVAYNGKLEDFMKYANGASKLFYRTEVRPFIVI